MTSQSICKNRTAGFTTDLAEFVNSAKSVVNPDDEMKTGFTADLAEFLRAS